MVTIALAFSFQLAVHRQQALRARVRALLRPLRRGERRPPGRDLQRVRPPRQALPQAAGGVHAQLEPRRRRKVSEWRHAIFEPRVIIVFPDGIGYSDTGCSDSFFWSQK